MQTKEELVWGGVMRAKSLTPTGNWLTDYYNVILPSKIKTFDFNLDVSNNPMKVIDLKLDL